MITYDCVASVNPRRMAAPLPWLKGWRTTRTRSSSRSSTMPGDPSVDPSSTTITSAVKGESSTRFNVVAMVADSLKHGMTTDKQASVIRESLGSHVVPVRLRPWSAVIAALVAIGVGERVWVLRGRWGVVDSDEAVVGLMARAFRHGHWQAFYWGQHYAGSLEPALVALFGASGTALKLVPVGLAAV